MIDTKQLFEYIADELGLIEGEDYQLAFFPQARFEKFAREVEEIARTKSDVAAEKHIRRTLQRSVRAEARPNSA